MSDAITALESAAALARSARIPASVRPLVARSFVSSICVPGVGNVDCRWIFAVGSSPVSLNSPAVAGRLEDLVAAFGAAGAPGSFAVRGIALVWCPSGLISAAQIEAFG